MVPCLDFRQAEGRGEKHQKSPGQDIFAHLELIKGRKLAGGGKRKTHKLW